MWILYLSIGIVAGLLIIFGISIIVYRNNLIALKEPIEKGKSEIRITKAKYVQVLNKTQHMTKKSFKYEGKAYKNVDANLLFGGIHDDYESSIEIVEKLAEELKKSQEKLNNLINDYNQYISVFPNLIFAKILKYKKEEYIDFYDLDKSKELDDSIDNQGI